MSFKIFRRDLKNDLEKIGLKTAFGMNADFSGISTVTRSFF